VPTILTSRFARFLDERLTALYGESMFTESRFTEIVIVGAGPTGLTLAIELARRGVPHRLLEQATDPFTGSRGKGLQPRTLEVLHELGVLEAFQAHGGLYPSLWVHRPDGEELEWRMDELHEATPDVPWPNGWMVPQWRTGELLARRLAELGGGIERGAGVTGLTQDGDGVHLTLTTGETVTARYVVGADGGRSTVRRALGVGFEGETHETQQMLIADVRLTGLDRKFWHLWPGDGQAIRLGLCPLAGTEDFQLTAPPTGAEPTLESLQALVSAIEPGITLTHVGWTSLFRANIRMVDAYRTGNVFLAGDAAHVHSPAGGQGLNTGIQDAFNLGWKLATGDDTLLDTYEAERLPVAAGVLGISTKLHNRARVGADDAMLRTDPVLRQLSLNYRGGPLAAERRPAPGRIRAGDRAPDAPLDGTRIFDLITGPEPILLAFDAPEISLPGVRVVHIGAPGSPAGVIDTEGHAHRAYDIQTPALLLVRPDNYIGCATAPSDVAAIEAYLRRIAPARVIA
jgi:2-polyprenyl-6-methoxyphenol hydroxylase-like FAD-dependent oxidoreductase